MTVYIDSLFLINFFMDTVILFITSVFRGFKTNTLRIFAAATVSAVYGVCIFFPDLAFVCGAFMKIAATCLIVYIAYGKSGFLRSLMMFWLVSAAAAGIILGLTVFTNFGTVLNSVISNLVMYMNINPLIMLLGCAVLYLLMEVYRRMCIRSFTCDKMLVDFCVYYMGREYKLVGLIDTGCELFEPLSGAPVIVADKRLFGSIAQDSAKIYIDTASGRCGLDMLLPEKIEARGNFYIDEKAVIALAENGFGGEARYNALINPAACRNINKERRRTKNDGGKIKDLVN